MTGGTLNLPRDYEFTRALTKSPMKFTCTGPHMLTKVLTDRHYGSRRDLAMAVADVLRKQLERVDADVVQLDEANISGHPEDSEWGAECINHVLDGVAGVRAVHICFGNYGGQSVQQGFWKSLMPFLNSLRADHLVLEFARRGYAEIEHFKELDPKIGLGLGVVDIKDNLIESPDLIAERIELAASALGAERVHYVHPDCGFWMLQRNVADRKMAALVAGAICSKADRRNDPANRSRHAQTFPFHWAARVRVGSFGQSGAIPDSEHLKNIQRLTTADRTPKHIGLPTANVWFSSPPATRTGATRSS